MRPCPQRLVEGTVVAWDCHTTGSLSVLNPFFWPSDLQCILYFRDYDHIVFGLRKFLEQISFNI